MSEIKHLDLGTNADYTPTPVATPDPTVTAVSSNPDFSYTSSSTTTTPASGKPMSRTKSSLPLVIMAVAIIAGVMTGAGAQKLMAKGGTSSLGLGSTSAPISQVATGTIKNGDVFGTADEKTFKDSAEGYLEKNTSEEGEGTHRLVRAGGESQTVFMISSVTDLDKFDGMNVKVWGETFKGQKAGWLMDVGRVQITNTQGTAPTAE